VDASGNGTSDDGPKTIWPSIIYDIRGVFDGTIISNGVLGHPTIMYTSTYTGSLGAESSPPEQEGAETQSLAYTTDGGETWIKFRMGAGNYTNPVIYQWPMQNLTGFRDPYVFESPYLTRTLGNSTKGASGDWWLTISGGQRVDANPDGGPILFLYRQTSSGDFFSWTYLGPLVSERAKTSYSEWSGNWGNNFETCAVTRLNTTGRGGGEDGGYNVVFFGTENGRDSHEKHWPIWSIVNVTNSSSSTYGDPQAVGVGDWGRVYAATTFAVNGTREVLSAWTYEDDEDLVLAKQRGWQGALIYFRDLFMLTIRNVAANSTGLYERGSWLVKNETDGSKTVITLGQRITTEILSALKSRSKVSNPGARTLTGSSDVVKLDSQPSGRFYAVTGQFNFSGERSTWPNVGFRVASSDLEYTDVYYDASNETVVIDRLHSSVINTYGNGTEYGKLRLWDIQTGNSTRPQSLNLTAIVDNSILEVFANDQLFITTRIYPWYSNSTGVGLISRNGTGSVDVSNLELWDGLYNAWPSRSDGPPPPLRWDGPLAAIYGLWAGW